MCIYIDKVYLYIDRISKYGVRVVIFILSVHIITGSKDIEW